MIDRLYRSRDERMVAGVAGGLAETLDADPSIIRIVWVILVFLTGGLALLVYVVMAVVVPERPIGMERPVAAQPGPPPVAGLWVGPDGSSVPLGGAAPPRSDRPGSNDAGRGGLIAGLVLVVIGALFLLRQLIPGIDLGDWWPLVAIGLGMVLIVLAVVPTGHPD